ncbi:MAG: DUF2219 family protein [Phycisphaera sp.]|nr:DUF2219 family protein [Phycisphaera sp.]
MRIPSDTGRHTLGSFAFCVIAALGIVSAQPLGRSAFAQSPAGSTTRDTGSPNLSSDERKPSDPGESTSLTPDGMGHEPLICGNSETPGADILIQWENDGAFFKPNGASDEHYTNGVRVDITFHPGFASDIAQALPLAPGVIDHPHDDIRSAFGLAIGQSMFTPRDTASTALITTDRPYVGWLYLGAYLQRQRSDVLDHLELDVGLTGQPSLAQDAQKWVHDLVGDPEPMGWNNQVRTEVDFNLIYTRKWRINILTTDDVAALPIVQLIPHAGLTLGTANRNAFAGFLVRAGINLPDDFGPSRIDNPRAATGQPRNGDLGFYVFGRVNGKAVQHDMFIQGGNFTNGPGKDVQALVGDVQAGVAVYWRYFELGYSQSFFTKQFKGEVGSDSFGGFYLVGTFCF